MAFIGGNTGATMRLLDALGLTGQHGVRGVDIRIRVDAAVMIHVIMERFMDEKELDAVVDLISDKLPKIVVKREEEDQA